MKTKNFKLLWFTVILLSLVWTFTGAFCAFAADNDGVISSVKVTSNLTAVEISAQFSKEFVNANKDYEIFVFKLAPYMSVDQIGSLTPEKSVTLKEKLNFEVYFSEPDIYSAYVLAGIKNGVYVSLTHPHYIDNPEVLAENPMPYPEKLSKKGLYSQIGSDAEQLGVEHTVISIDMNQFMSMTFKEETEPYIKNGQTFYFYKDMLKQLDHRVKVYTEAGMNVYFNIVLGNDNGSGLSSIYPNTGSGKASYYAIDTNTFSSVRYYTAFCEFMAERYSDTDTSNGFVPAYILGYEVDTYSWNYAGEVSLEEYAKKYENAFRILYTAVKSVYPEGKVFASVSNVFNASEDTAYSLGYRSFLDKLAENFRAGGDIDWSLSVNPHPSSHATNEFWNDEKAVDSLDTEYITMKNLDVLSNYMSSETMTYNDRLRDIIIGEFGIGGNIDDARDNDRQAGAYALAYAIADKNPDIDALIYYRHVDYFAEPIKFGLWSSVSTSPLTPVSKKAIYNVFRNADTSAYTEGLEMARVFCGDMIYERYLSDYTPSVKKNISEALPITSSDIPTGFKSEKIFDLTAGTLCDFYPSNNCSYIELRQRSSDSPETSMYAKMSPVSGVTYMGVSRKLDGTELDGSYLSLKFTPVTPVDETVTVMLRLEGGKDTTEIFEGIVQLTSNTENELVFKIADFIKRSDGEINMLKLWYKPSSGALSAGEYGLWLDSFTLYSSTGLSLFLTLLLVFFGILLLIAVIISVTYIIKHKELRNRFKGFVGKTRSKFMKFLMSKKIISQHKKKPRRAAKPSPVAAVAKNEPIKSDNKRVTRDTPNARPRVMTGADRQSRPTSARITPRNLQTDLRNRPEDKQK